MRRDHLEAPVQAGALELLHHAGFRPMRINSGRILTREGRWVRLAPAGTSDVIAIVPRSGRMLAAEIKARGKARDTTEAQDEFLRAVRDSGGVAVVIDDLKELERVVKELITDPWATIYQGHL